MNVRRATPRDVDQIQRVLRANRHDISLFQQPLWRIRRDINDFVVAEADDGAVVGCSAVHWHTQDNAEILAVSVAPTHQGTGVGKALIAKCVEWAEGGGDVWLSTKKPGYFSRLGFRSISMWSLPLSVLLYKLRLVIEQPISRWIPALTRGSFMRQRPT